MSPSLSVVIPTYNRAATLEAVLRGLARQSLPPGEFEIVIVDDGSTDNTAEVAQRFVAQSAAAARYLHQNNRGPAAARNAGIAASCGSLLVFIGDDTIPTADFLRQHAQYHAEHNRDDHLVVVGYTTWPAAMRPSPFLRFAGQQGAQFDYAHMTPGQPLSHRYFYSSNLSLRRGLLAGLDRPFDESFTSAMWEDTELGYRLAQRGMVLHYLPDAVLFHDHPTTLAAFCHRVRQTGRVSRQLLAKHPELETELLSAEQVRRIYRLARGVGSLVPLADFLDRCLRLPLPKAFYRLLLKVAYAQGAAGAAGDG